MFVYQKDNAICVTFKDNKPVAAPEYVIVIDEENKSFVINGQSIAVATESEKVEEDEVQNDVVEVTETEEPVETNESSEE